MLSTEALCDAFSGAAGKTHGGCLNTPATGAKIKNYKLSKDECSTSETHFSGSA